MNAQERNTIRALLTLLEECVEELDGKRNLSNKLLDCAKQLHVLIAVLRKHEPNESELASVLRMIILRTDMRIPLEEYLLCVAVNNIAAIECAHYGLSDQNVFSAEVREFTVRSARELIVGLIRSINMHLGSLPPAARRTLQLVHSV